MKKVLVVLTNVDHFEKDGEKTGLWLSEATEFVNEVERQAMRWNMSAPEAGVYLLIPEACKTSS